LKATAALLAAVVIILGLESSSIAASESLMTSLASGNYSRVDAQTDVWKDQYEVGKIGGDEYLENLSNILPRGSLSKSMEVDLRNWESAFPKSYAASFVLGEFYSRLGFQLRGAKTASQTSAQQQSDFKQYEAQARDQLLASIKLSAKAYPSYCELIDTALALGDGKINEYFLAANLADRYAIRDWQALLHSRSPNWGGSIAEMDKILDLANKSPLQDSEKKHLAAINFTFQAQDAESHDRYDDAIRLYRAAYKVLPGKDTAWRLVDAANTAKKGGMFDEAIALYGKALQADPANTKALNERGWMFENEKKAFDSAFKDYEKSANLGNSWAQNRAGWFLMIGRGTTKDIDQARDYLGKAAAQGDKSAPKHLQELATPDSG
jgi:TPR repeat protein